MDAQMKRGFLEVCVLASINRQDSYGYQIVKDVPAILNLTESTLYPLLKRLEAAGLLTTYSVEHSGRLRKYYRITEAGVRHIDEFLRERDDVVSIYDYVKRGARQ
ncbi:MAG: PadR family transcriptional regulator [Gordonibacter pamelaeae]|jgi:PadR family transcriptional regulator PadR|uniref:Transcriptional regulator, PadR family n=3 Tax=Gordonibacter TaxID=644652 RepID=D6EBD7_9ACTN|nr:MULTISPECIES: PadR family transcriptional regulator [Gordonibacter]HJH72505.1 PadR family transcriptional regulator [Eggerthellaceae bacterium]MBS4895026.1 PadR family transcriptional regulator [Gordonibacter pamelaeae]MCB6311628.1 PadR family transcriptional regulator [Gordonibacter pamelaeae]MCQ4846371.1 PadR family transcriptional regulator [Gordonibacter pamelaeae]MCQ4850434.1 PadR family transcriptional regulator [Gordonibacter pamelaeae]